MIFHILISIKNECHVIQGEIYHLNNIHFTHSNRLQMLDGELQNLMRRNSIEKEAKKRIGMTFPVPESLIVYMDIQN